MSKIIEKYKSLPLPLKASLWFIACSITQKAIAFVTTPLFTRMMSVTEYGQVTMFNSWNEVFTIIATLDIFYGVYNNVLIKYKDRRAEATSSLLTFTTILTLFVFILYLFFQEQINELTGMSTIATELLFAEILFVSAMHFWSMKERFDYRYKNLAIATLLLAILNPTFGIALVSLSSQKGHARIISIVLANIIVCFPIFISIMKKGKAFVNKEYWKYAVGFNLPLVPHYLSSVILNQSDRIMIDNMVGTDKAGIYGLAYSIGMITSMVNQAIMNSYTPWTYKKLEERNYDDLKRITRIILTVVGLFPVLFTCFAPEILMIMGGEKYQEGIWLIAPLTASVFFRFLYSLYGNVEFYFEANKFTTVASLLSALFNIILNYICINAFGYIAAGYTTLACFAFYAFAHCAFASHVQKKKIGSAPVYDNKFMLLISCAVIVICLSIMMTFNLTIIRYLIIMSLVTIAFFTRKKIIKTIRLIRSREEH